MKALVLALALAFFGVNSFADETTPPAETVKPPAGAPTEAKPVTPAEKSEHHRGHHKKAKKSSKKESSTTTTTTEEKKPE
jgi:hypothetical protein